MAILGPNFQDFTMKDQFMTCKLHFTRFNGRFRLAQIWLDRTLVEKMQPFVPYKTGKFLSKINRENAGKWGSGEIVTSVPPQGKYLYPGINPNTGRAFHWTNPQTQPRWGTYTYERFKPELQKGIKHILVKGEYPKNG